MLSSGDWEACPAQSTTMSMKMNFFPSSSNQDGLTCGPFRSSDGGMQLVCLSMCPIPCTIVTYIFHGKWKQSIHVPPVFPNQNSPHAHFTSLKQSTRSSNSPFIWWCDPNLINVLNKASSISRYPLLWWRMEVIICSVCQACVVSKTRQGHLRQNSQILCRVHSPILKAPQN